MTDFIQGENRHQSTLFPELLDDYLAEDNAVPCPDHYLPQGNFEESTTEIIEGS